MAREGKKPAPMTTEQAEQNLIQRVLSLSEREKRLLWQLIEGEITMEDYPNER